MSSVRFFLLVSDSLSPLPFQSHPGPEKKAKLLLQTACPVAMNSEKKKKLGIRSVNDILEGKFRQ